MLISLVLLLTLMAGVSLFVAGTLRTIIVRRRRAREKAHILRRVADLEEHLERDPVPGE